jgi:geranylgeranyl diphosphate synthase type I
MSVHPSITARLGHARDHVVPGLRAAVGSMHPHLARACGYHFGWCSVDGDPIEGAIPSKFLRATLTLLAAEAAGGSAQDAVPGAVAVELLHNHSILHDDIIDEDDLRRGRRTVWSAFGTQTAVLAGDALAAAAFGHLSEAATPPRPRALGMLTEAFGRICDGQAADLRLQQGRPASIEAYLRMSADKTSALLACSAGIGAVLAGADEATIAGLRAACTDLGLAWQAVNDVEDIWGDPAVTGKPPLSDLRQGKVTLPVLAALTSGTPAARELADHRADAADHDPDRLQHIADLITRAGGRAAAERVAEDRLAAAEQRLQDMPLPDTSRRALSGLFRFIVTRSA